MVKNSFVIAALFACVSAFAAPALPGQWKIITLSDGTEVRVELKGDEFCSWWEGADGIVYEQVANAQWARAEVNARYQARAQRRATLGDKTTEYIGTKKGLIIMVQFADLSFQSSNTRDFYDRVANEENFSEGKFVGSVKDYFRDQSYGQFEIDFDVLGPITMPNGYAYYGADTDGYTSNISALAEMIITCCDAVDDEVDFNDYDWDGDGEADMVFFLYAGQGQHNGGSSDTIWAHLWYLSSANNGKTASYDGVTIDTYACSSELNSTKTVAGIGTFCHEFSHCLGLPDVYDTSSSASNYAMGNWDVLCYGNYNGHSYGDAYIPAGYTSYERWFAGWLEPTELTTDGEYSLRALTGDAEAYIIYNERVKSEYYMLENRQKSGWDAGLAGEGLIILHIDYDKSAWANNTVNYSTQHYTMFAANNNYDRSYEYGHAYPYNGNNSLTNSSTPAAKLLNTNVDGTYYMNKPITEISLEDGVVSFYFANETGVTADENAPESWVFYESFNACGGKGGNDGTWEVSASDLDELTTDNEIWVESVGGGAWMCAFLGGTLGKMTLGGEVKSPEITIENDGVLQFKAAPYAGDDLVLNVSLITDDDISLGTSTFNMTDGEWSTYNADLQGVGTLQLKFTSEGRFFLDEVYVSEVESDGIRQVAGSRWQVAADAGVYDLSGRAVNQPVKGFYIINGKKVIINK